MNTSEGTFHPRKLQKATRDEVEEMKSRMKYQVTQICRLNVNRNGVKEDSKRNCVKVQSGNLSLPFFISCHFFRIIIRVVLCLIPLEVTFENTGGFEILSVSLRFLGFSTRSRRF
jgi:hypothetical protein